MAKKKTPRDTAAAPDVVYVDTAEPWPDPDGTWTHEDYVAHARAMQEEDAKYVPTAEELEMGKRFLRKQESASGYNQVDPNAD